MASEKLEKPELNEIATTRDGRDITRGYVDGLPLLEPEDTVLRLRGANDYRIYEEVLRDDQVKTTFEQRRLGVVSHEWFVEPGGKSAEDVAAADELRETLKRLSFDAVTDKMLYGIFYGFAVSECLWGVDGDRVVLRGINVRKPRRFGFAPDGSLRLRTTKTPTGEALPDRKFWVYASNTDNDDEPYGIGLAHWLYWPTFFKRHDVKFWMVFLEKFGQPTAVGTYPPNAVKEEQDRLLETLGAIQTDSGIIMPEGMKVALLEAARSGSADYAAMHQTMDAAISKVVLGQTMTTDAGSSLSQAEVHWDVREALLKADADLVCESFNAGPARWLTEWNHPTAALPRVWRRFVNAGALKSQSETEKTIAETSGYRPTLRHIQETYGGEWEEKPAAPQLAAPGGPPAFAEPSTGADAPSQFAGQLDEAAAQVLDGLLEKVKEIVATSKDLQEVQDRLLTAYGELDPETLGSLMTRALVAAELAGRAEVASRG